MKPRKPEPKDYTFVGNTPNVGQAPDLLVKLRETHPTVYKMLAHQKKRADQACATRLPIWRTAHHNADGCV